jgi:hypothetical protein
VPSGVNINVGPRDFWVCESSRVGVITAPIASAIANIAATRVQHSAVGAGEEG